jgi:hypothetical protein
MDCFNGFQQGTPLLIMFITTKHKGRVVTMRGVGRSGVESISDFVEAAQIKKLDDHSYSKNL